MATFIETVVRISNPTPVRSSQVKSSYSTKDGQYASLSWCQAPATSFSPFLLWLVSDGYGFSDVRRPPWREIGSVVINFCWYSSLCPVPSMIHPFNTQHIFWNVWMLVTLWIVTNERVFFSDALLLRNIYHRIGRIHNLYSCLVKILLK
jgi:hypothetical protein